MQPFITLPSQGGQDIDGLTTDLPIEASRMSERNTIKRPYKKPTLRRLGLLRRLTGLSF